MKLVKLYVKESTAAELDRAVAASGLSRAAFVGAAFVVGTRSLASLLSVKLD